MLGLRINLSRIGIFVTQDVSGKLHSRLLHSVTKTEVWNLVFARELDCRNYSLNRPRAVASGYYNSVEIRQNINALFFYIGRIDPLHLRFEVKKRRGVFYRLNYRKIGIG